jgi:membrane protease YdiL (CAAX protease family)
MKHSKLWYYVFALLGTFMFAGAAQGIAPFVPVDYQGAVVLTMAQAGPFVAVLLVNLFSRDYACWRLMNWKRVGKEDLGKLLVSFGIPATVIASGALILSAVGIGYVPAGYTATSATLTVIAAIVGCVFEEIGWRGYLLPLFLRKYSLFLSAIFTGLLWGAWHFPKLITAGPASYLMFIVLITELTVIMAGVYAWTGGDMVSMIIFHLGVNVASMFMVTGREGTLFYLASIVVATIVSVIALLGNKTIYFARKGENEGLIEQSA